MHDRYLPTFHVRALRIFWKRTRVVHEPADQLSVHPLPIAISAAISRLNCIPRNDTITSGYIWGFYSVTIWKGYTSTPCSNIVRENRFQGRVLETFVPYVHEVVVRYMAQSWVLQKSSKIA